MLPALRKLIPALLSVVLAATTVAPASAEAVKPGGKCVTNGKKATLSGVSYTCTKTSRGMKWVAASPKDPQVRLTINFRMYSLTRPYGDISCASSTSLRQAISEGQCVLNVISKGDPAPTMTKLFAWDGLPRTFDTACVTPIKPVPPIRVATVNGVGTLIGAPEFNVGPDGKLTVSKLEDDGNLGVAGLSVICYTGNEVSTKPVPQVSSSQDHEIYLDLTTTGTKSAFVPVIVDGPWIGQDPARLYCLKPAVNNQLTTTSSVVVQGGWISMAGRQNKDDMTIRAIANPPGTTRNWAQIWKTQLPYPPLEDDPKRKCATSTTWKSVSSDFAFQLLGLGVSS